jgi:hypothetical protein
MRGCVEHEDGRAFGCRNCDAIARHMSEPGFSNFAWLRTELLAARARIAELEEELRSSSAQGDEQERREK